MKSALQDRRGQVGAPATNSRWGLRALSFAGALLAAACGGGGGGGGSFDSSAQLSSITFPGDAGSAAIPSPPTAASLVQQVVFAFTGRPDPDRVSANSLPIRDLSGVPVPGSYHVDGRIVTFTPTLPTRPITLIGDGVYDTGGTGLAPGSAYTIRLGPQTFSFVSDVDATLRRRFPDPVDPKGVLISFKTTIDASEFLAGLDTGRPQLVQADPVDGTTGVSPNLYTDPEHRFAPRRSFSLTFDRPVNPGTGNVNDSAFKLIDLDDPATHALALGVDVRMTENELDRAVVEVAASGILPFGHLLALECANDLQGISQTGALSGAMKIATTFTIATAPASTVRDALVENFDTIAREEIDPNQIGVGSLPARWDERDSNLLQANFTFQGDGVLGRFLPPTPPNGTTRIIYLDTTRQAFPLPDGSTPDAPPNFDVVGGVFSFSDIDIPDGIVIKPLGSNPLVITATGSIHIAGDIDISGQDGTPENSYDSAVTSIPGGQGVAGGGRGGEGHPIFFYPPDQISYLNLVSPSYGGQGFGIDPADGIMKRIGGSGGQCGCLDLKDSKGLYATNQEIDCNEFRSGHDREKVPGGGGGSLYRKGEPPYKDPKDPTSSINGIGNVLPDGTGHFTARDDTTLLCGTGGQHPFADDGDKTNDFFGSRGQLRRLIGGQGGGSGASLTESYYCGVWCDHDSDPNNDAVCQGTDFGDPPTRGDSVGDARGGGGGGGGGALLLQALGSITIDSTSTINASGGDGKGGEAIGCSWFGGSGAGGAGGMIVVQSGTSILVRSGALLDVRRGLGDIATDGNACCNCDDGGFDGWAIGDGGNGGDGLVQLQVPAGLTATVENSSPTGSIQPNSSVRSSWIDPTNTLNPVEFTPMSVAVSKWFDLGRVTQRPPPAPVFTFTGTNTSGPHVGEVKTDGNGNVDPLQVPDIVCGYLGQVDPVTHLYKLGEEPRANFIPTNATIKVEFQGANPLVAGSKEIDPASITPAPNLWSTSPTVANGKQFIRWRITFDLSADGSALTPSTRLPVVEQVQINTHF